MGKGPGSKSVGLAAVGLAATPSDDDFTAFVGHLVVFFALLVVGQAIAVGYVTRVARNAKGVVGDAVAAPIDSQSQASGNYVVMPQ
mmetsp:Transcript_22997/g.64302  ORF Transcript_22997/g.64302 Transcript_22997/m.64302 type:complete len:86 (-) Transcript_22997:187-444(-)